MSAAAGLLAWTQARPLVHAGLEWLAYFLAARVYLRHRRRDPLGVPANDQLLLLGAAIFGAAAGAISLHLAESWTSYRDQSPAAWLAGKSVLGGLLGGTLATEWAKRAIGFSRSTGDAWVPALAVGLVVGRIGCQLSGPWDMTYGAPTGASWGWDYGDGVPRWPTAAMEALAVAGLAIGVTIAVPTSTSTSNARAAPRPGTRFNAFLLGYCLLRFLVEFLKPPFGEAAPGAIPVDRFGGLTAIQWTALAGLAWMSMRLARGEPPVESDTTLPPPAVRSRSRNP